MYTHTHVHTHVFPDCESQWIFNHQLNRVRSTYACRNTVSVICEQKRASSSLLICCPCSAKSCCEGGLLVFRTQDRSALSTYAYAAQSMEQIHQSWVPPSHSQQIKAVTGGKRETQQDSYFSGIGSQSAIQQF